MSCLFGYYGRPDPRLLDRMADRLGHRCRGGWERRGIDPAPGVRAAVGRGRAPWSVDPHTESRPEPPLLFGYGGVLFGGSPAIPETGAGSPRLRDLAAELARDPAGGLSALHGAFVAALALRDDFFLIRDPAGIKVLYWTRTPDRLLFASEVKALFADPRVPRRIRPGALAEYFTFSFVPGEGTMFEGIFELQPGTLLRWADGQVALDRRFRFEGMEADDATDPDIEGWTGRMRSALAASVRECREAAGGSPAVFLSGGIDSSAVLAHAARQSGGTPVKTFSVHFGPKYANENAFVAMMVERWGTDHTWLEIRPKGFLRRLREIIRHLDDPIGDPITVPNYLLAEAASRIAPAVLNGEGGDPCFGGPKNIPMMLADLYGRMPGDPPEGWLERAYLRSYRKCFDDLGRLLSPEVFAASGGDDALAAILTPFFTADRPRSFLNKLMSINIRLKGANLILVKVEKMTAANGLLALAPLFSRRIIEFSMACPPGLKLMGNVEKGILKRSARGMVPDPIIERPKSGMMVPVRFWLQGEMRRYARRMLSRKNLRRLGYFDVSYVRSLLDYDRTEVQSQRFGLKLWMLITFMLWHEQMVEGKSP